MAQTRLAAARRREVLPECKPDATRKVLLLLLFLLLLLLLLLHLLLAVLVGSPLCPPSVNDVRECTASGQRNEHVFLYGRFP